MQSLGNSQKIVTPPTVDLTSTTTTEGPSKGSEVQVGKQESTTKTTAPRTNPGLTVKFKGSDISSRRVLSKEGLVTAFGATPSTSAKAKTFFASGFNKIARGLGFNGVRKSDFVELTKAAKTYAKAKAEGASPDELMPLLRTMKIKLESHQARHPGKLENSDEVLDMIKAELGKLDVLSEIEEVDQAPNPAGKTAIYSSILKKYDELAQKNPDNFTIGERKDVIKALTAKIAKAASDEGLDGLSSSAHRELMQGIQSSVRDHVTGAKTSTILRQDGDVMVSKPHAYLVLNDHMKGVVKDTLDLVKGQNLEVNPSKLSKEEVEGGQVDKNRSKLQSAFEGICDSMGISEDKGIRDLGVGALPQELCDHAKCLYDEIIKAGHGDAAARKAVASLIMLKLMCPIMLAPQGSDTSPAKITDSPMDGPTQRSMVLLNKMMQNLANEVTSNGKEEYMIPLNKVQVGRMPAWKDFVDAVVARGRDVDSL